MPKKVSVKKAATKEVCCCGNCCGGVGQIDSVVHIIFGGLVVALSFFLLQSTL